MATVAEQQQMALMFAAHRRLVAGHITGQVRQDHRAEVEDLTQETFLRAWQSIRRGAGPSDETRLAGWLCAIARHVVTDHYRSRRVDLVPTDDTAPVWSRAAVDVADVADPAPSGVDLDALRVIRFVEDIGIRLPVPSESKALAIPEGVPVARVFRTAYDAHGRALEVLDSLVPTDRYAFRYVIDVP